MPRHFTPKTFSFLRDLADNNDREWFAANKDRYENDVREPALDFIQDFADRLVKISPHFSADPRKQGGSMFRIHRDTRFSKDKTPYKIHTGVQFRHVATKDDVHAPGFYLHIQPGECWAGVGLWRPSTEDARSIRQAIHDDPAGWKKAAYGKRFTDRYELMEGDPLVRVPKEFDPEHTHADDLRRRSFVASSKLTQKAMTSDGFVDEYAALCSAASPFMRFLCDAVGVAF
jgi:uncharacterized protein (TIGR02453 family)